MTPICIQRQKRFDSFMKTPNSGETVFYTAIGPKKWILHLICSQNHYVSVKKKILKERFVVEPCTKVSDETKFVFSNFTYQTYFFSGCHTRTSEDSLVKLFQC